MIVDLEKVAAVIEEIAETEIAARFGKLSDGDIDTKSSPSDFVTQADRAAEAALEITLKDFYPGAGFVGEESVAGDPSRLNALGGEGAFWIVDPLDGTRNFVQQRKEFGTIVSLVVDGTIRAGWIYAIPEKKFAIASKGEGVRWAGKMLGPLPSPTDAMIGYRAIGNMEEPWKSTLIPRLKESFETAPAHCSAYGYLNLIRGSKDFGLYSRCHPWDHAAGVLMLHEIGGRAEYLDDGSDYAPLASQGRPLLIAGSAARFERVRSVLLGLDEGKS